MFGFLKKLFSGSTPQPELTAPTTPEAVGEYYYRIKDIASGPYDDLPDDVKRADGSSRIDIQCVSPNHAAQGNFDGPFTWLDLQDIPADLGRLKDPNLIVAPKGRIKLLIDYPLTQVAVATIATDRPEGFTLAAILAALGEVYVAVYDEETATQSEPTPPVAERGNALNRPPSDGVFGISAHDLNDLGVGSLIVIPTSDGVWVRPEIES